ncbi:hypothetical protein KSS87_001482 [Heliosperma pusillum]|nr:hypothetical protein KSS87_001482 [Heliosperma pusillum]
MKLWKRFGAEVSTEIHLLAEKWKYILGGLVCQVVFVDFVDGFRVFDYWIACIDLLYIHGLAARGVHYIHRPGPTLQDAGFFLLPASQFLRIITFYSTQLPGPNYHCREGSKLATLPPPRSAIELFIINFPSGVLYGCGDLIFSSHMIFSLVFIRTYQKYGTKRLIKQLAWLLAVVQSLLIIASRKHYTVDVVVAWYTVNLVVFFVDSKLPEMPDRSSGGASLLLPLSNKDKDSWNKEENHKLLNGNGLDPTDRRQRNGMNGKILEDGLTHNDNAMNGA